jgi:tetrahydromethanopterin S-methyltransferase subunit G
MMMTETEEVVVLGEDFIERRIFVCPQQAELDYLQRRAYRFGYNRGCTYGLIFGLVLFGTGAILTWLVLW